MLPSILAVRTLTELFIFGTVACTALYTGHCTVLSAYAHAYVNAYVTFGTLVHVTRRCDVSMSASVPPPSLVYINWPSRLTMLGNTIRGKRCELMHTKFASWVVPGKALQLYEECHHDWFNPSNFWKVAFQHWLSPSFFQFSYLNFSAFCLAWYCCSYVKIDFLLARARSAFCPTDFHVSCSEW